MIVFGFFGLFVLIIGFVTGNAGKMIFGVVLLCVAAGVKYAPDLIVRGR